MQRVGELAEDDPGRLARPRPVAGSAPGTGRRRRGRAARRRSGPPGASARPRRPRRTISGTLAGSRPFSFRLYLTAMAASISWTTATNVSITPWPCGGHRAGRPAGPRGSAPVRAPLAGRRSGRSCLLYWRTSGHLLRHQPVGEQVHLHVLEGGLVLLEQATRRESATKTTASAPASTTRRVALYWTWPGTV